MNPVIKFISILLSSREQAQNFISQANTNYHEYGQEEKPAAPDDGAM